MAGRVLYLVVDCKVRTMSNVKNNAASQETRRKLIEAAGEVYALRGLHAATIKEITAQAGVNCAAINYHFRDKFELYAAVVRHALKTLQVSSSVENLPGTPEQRLQAMIAEMFRDVGSASRPMWCTTILAHEFAQPTAALDAVIDELMRPRAEILDNIVREILGPAFTERQALLATLSVVSQCVLYMYNRELVMRLHPGLLEKNSWDQVAKHVVDFSLTALRAMKPDTSDLSD